MPGSVPDVHVSVDGGVLVAVLDRPDRLNAVRAQTLRELLAVLGEAERRSDVHSVVITGRGRAFSAGQDLAELRDRLADPGDALADGTARAHLDHLQSVTRRMLAHPKVLVAAVNGVAVGFGAELALACDVRIAGPDARMGFVEVNRGLFETNGVLWTLPRLVGHGRAADLLLTGEIVDAAEAHRIGLVSRLVPDTDPTAAAVALARRIASGAPTSLRLLKQALR
ncbi:MAG TPA: enoyl-CoA hydratase/isomerase family protein, partial [Pseudonocardia sp.]|nr:enoyl-CoA hydratase/isomerase family protein [Pseudonocardia sp.]